MRVRSVAVAVAIASCVACSRSGGNDARFEPSTGWLVTKVAEQKSGAKAVGDRKHVWIWSKDQPGVRTVDTSGNVSRPLLADVHVNRVIEAGDRRHGLVVPEKKPGLFLIQVDGDEEESKRNLLPGDAFVASTSPVEGGVWIAAGPQHPDESFPSDHSIYFFEARSQHLLGPWAGLGALQRAYTSRYAISFDEEVWRGRRDAGFAENGPITGGQITATIVDNQSGVITFPIKLAFDETSGDGAPLPQFTPDRRYVWAAAALMKGAFRIDIEAAVKARNEGRPYEPLVVLADRKTTIKVLDRDRIVAVPPTDDFWMNRTSAPRPTGATLVDVSSGVETRTPVSALANDTVRELEPIDGTTWFVGVESGPESSRALIVSNLTDRTGLDPLMHYFGNVEKTADSTKFLASSEDVWRVDATSKEAESIVGRDDSENPISMGSQRPQTVADANDRLFWITARSRRPFRGTVAYDAVTGKLLNPDHALFFKEPDLPEITPFGDGMHAIASAAGLGTMLIDRNAALPPFRLRLGRDDLTAAEAPAEVAFDAGSSASDAAFSIKGWTPPLNPEAKIDLRVACGGKEWTASGTASSMTDFNDMYGKRNALPWDKPCGATATFSDMYGSRFVWHWTKFRLVPPTVFYERPWFRSIAVFVFICIFIAIGASLRGGIQRWAPLAVYAGGGLAGTITGVSNDKLLNLPLLIALLAAAAAIACLCGVLSPAAFRELERIEPFRSLAPLAVSAGSIRRRLYASYVQRVADDVDGARQRANAEVYSPVPLRKLGARQATLDLTALPAQAVLDLLIAPDLDTRAHVLIESTGGRGKSALIREVIDRALAAFARDPRSPLPIVCDGSGATLFERAKQKLGTDDGFSDELFRVLLRSGEFFLVVDGLTEQGVDAAMLREQLAGYGVKCPLLLAGRPNDALRAAVESAKAWVIAEPQRLDDTTLRAFLTAYARTDDDFPEAAREACRHRDEQTYLPILVRLAILPRQGNALTIAAIYDSAIHTLLDEKGIPLDDAVDLCFATYWHDGQRQLVYALAEAERKTVLARLVGAGLLVPGDLGHAGAAEPRMVQFFHDTMQSYLTAVALSRQEEWREVLLRAAGEPQFVRDQSDLASHGGSELFQMCLHIFEPRFKTRNLLQSELLRLAKDHGSSLSRDWVVEESDIDGLAEKIDPNTAGGDALTIAIEQAARDPEIWSLGSLYSATARFLWTRIKDRRKAADQGASSVA